MTCKNENCCGEGVCKGNTCECGEAECLWECPPESLVQKSAPDFTAEAVMPDGSTKEEFTLSSFKGQYVYLFFYPFDFTYVCPSEILAFNGSIEEFKKRNCQLIGVSVDSAHVHRAWRSTPIEKGGIGPVKFPLVADITKSISRNYKILVDQAKSLRGSFLIDKEGIVRYKCVNDLPLGRSVDEAIRMVDALQHYEEHGEVCPANWRKGMTAMKPSDEGVASYLGKTFK
eukprot:Filipodium_phascolosomae@DN5706_c0_g1_i1.p1